MPRLGGYSTSSSSIDSKDPVSGCLPAPKNAQFSTRVQTLLEEVSPLKTTNVSPQSRALPIPKEEAAEESQAARDLARLESLPPLSPEGRGFSTGIRQGKFKYADVAGDRLCQFLQDGLPNYEEQVGEKRANDARRNIRVLRRGDPGEIKVLLSMATGFETEDKWAADEKSKVSKYPTAICTSGVAEPRPTGQHGGARGNWETHTPAGLGKTKRYPPETLWMRGQTVYSSESGAESPTSLTPSGVSDFDYSPSEKETAPNDNHASAGQWNAEDWLESPDGWTTSAQSSDYDSDDDGPASEDKLLYEMFPHQRFREP